MSYVILDLEWNGSYSKIQHKFVNEIIEFGAVKTDDKFNIIDTFSSLITPKIGKKLCSKVKELTKITNEELQENGISFMEAIEKFTEFSSDSVLVTWSTSDIHALIENYMYYTSDYHLPFLSKYCNLQEYCEVFLNLNDVSAQLGLSACAEMLGVDFSEDEQHRADADAELTLKCLEKVYSKLPIDEFIQDTEKNSFYERMMFKTHFITDINNPYIDKSEMFFICEDCSKKCTQLTKWKIHNKAFIADFYCKTCKRKFIGRITFKKKYDCVVIRKKLNEKKPAKNNTE